MAKIKFRVAGMHCKSCNMLIEDILGEEDAVKNVKADFTKGTVDVDYDEKKIDSNKLKSHIENEAGYTVEG